MAENPNKKNPVLSYFNLSDEYERRARFLPALLSMLVVLPVGMAFGVKVMQFLTLLMTGAGIGAVLAVGISHLASALGNRFQESLWPGWPHDSPTNMWLASSDKSRSSQQKKNWHKAIKRLTSIDIAKAVKAEDKQEEKAAINDAVTAVRSMLWESSVSGSELVRLRNIEYGYARNVTAFRVLWLPAAFLSCAGCWAAWWWFQADLLWAVVSSSLLVVLPFLAFWVLPEYVKRKANYYSESLFAAIEQLAAENESTS